MCLLSCYNLLLLSALNFLNATLSHFEYTSKILDHFDCLLHRYVVEKDVENNVVFVSRNYFSVDKRRRQFRVGSLRWFNGSPPTQTTQIQCKVFISVYIYTETMLKFPHIGRRSLIQLGSATKKSYMIAKCKWMLLKGHLKYHIFADFLYAFEWGDMKLQLSVVLFL